MLRARPRVCRHVRMFSISPVQRIRGEYGLFEHRFFRFHHCGDLYSTSLAILSVLCLSVPRQRLTFKGAGQMVSSFSCRFSISKHTWSLLLGRALKNFSQVCYRKKLLFFRRFSCSNDDAKMIKVWPLTSAHLRMLWFGSCDFLNASESFSYVLIRITAKPWGTGKLWTCFHEAYPIAISWPRFSPGASKGFIRLTQMNISGSVCLSVSQLWRTRTFKDCTESIQIS